MDKTTKAAIITRRADAALISEHWRVLSRQHQENGNYILAGLCMFRARGADEAVAMCDKMLNDNRQEA